MKATASELAEKERRVRALMTEYELDGILLMRQDNFAWFTGGGESRVSAASETGTGSLLISTEGKWLLCDNIESHRLLEEELEGQGFKLEEWMWWEGNVEDAAAKLAPLERIGSDRPIRDARLLDQGIARLRWSLLPEERERYRWLGRKVGECMGEACASLKPGMTEHGVASELASRLLPQGIFPVVLLVAADERAFRYRHPLPTDKQIEKHAMAVVCARKWGLIVSATRIVRFGQPEESLAAKHAAVARVDAVFIAATIPGVLVRDIFQLGQDAYSEVCFPDEWKLHHQGGPTGYATREFRASPQRKEEVLPYQAFAWNPSISGTKSEDTIIAAPGGPEILSGSPNWPMVEVSLEGTIIQRPDMLIL
jgi:Xaa-Pro aminopeptidase